MAKERGTPLRLEEETKKINSRPANKDLVAISMLNISFHEIRVRVEESINN